MLRSDPGHHRSQNYGLTSGADAAFDTWPSLQLSWPPMLSMASDTVIDDTIDRLNPIVPAAIVPAAIVPACHHPLLHSSERQGPQRQRQRPQRHTIKVSYYNGSRLHLEPAEIIPAVHMIANMVGSNDSARVCPFAFLSAVSSTNTDFCASEHRISSELYLVASLSPFQKVISQT